MFLSLCCRLITKFDVHSQSEKSETLKQLSEEFLESPISKDVQNPKVNLLSAGGLN